MDGRIIMLNTEVIIAGVTFKNPVMTASGTFGSGIEYSEFVDFVLYGVYQIIVVVFVQLDSKLFRSNLLLLV